MIRAKNYETVSKFFKVRHGVVSYRLQRLQKSATRDTRAWQLLKPWMFY